MVQRAEGVIGPGAGGGSRSARRGWRTRSGGSMTRRSGLTLRGPVGMSGPGVSDCSGGVLMGRGVSIGRAGRWEEVRAGTWRERRGARGEISEGVGRCEPQWADRHGSRRAVPPDRQKPWSSPSTSAAKADGVRKAMVSRRAAATGAGADSQYVQLPWCGQSTWSTANRCLACDSRAMPRDEGLTPLAPRVYQRHEGLCHTVHDRMTVRRRQDRMISRFCPLGIQSGDVRTRREHHRNGS